MTASCRKDPAVPQTDSPRLKGIALGVSKLLIPLGGSAELPFSVRDADYPLNIDVSSLGCQVSLYGNAAGAIPFHLSSIRKGEKTGDYVAVLKRDFPAYFNVQVKLELKLSASELLRSEAVPVLSEEGNDLPVHTGLPVVFVETTDRAAVTSKEDWLGATVSIAGVGQYPDLNARPAFIRGRGNTTWTWPKKPFAFKFESKTEIMGMPAHKRWVLLANFMDRTLMRNALAFRLGSLSSLAWTPGYRYCELVLNGRHMGNYLLTEQLRVDKDRIALDENSSGSFLFESDFHYDNRWQWLEYFGHSWRMGGSIPFSIKYPDDEDIAQDAFEAAQNYINQRLTVLYGNDFKDPLKGYRAYLDVDSFIDYWIVFELMGNHELNNPGSVFTHVSAGGRWTAGPLWDFDWGSLSYNTSPQARTGLLCKDAVWYARLFQDPWFVDRLRKRWNELLPVFREESSYIDSLKLVLTQSAILNFGMWNPAEDASQNGGNIINGDENLSFGAAVDLLLSIYLERLEVISTSLAAL